MAGIADEFRKKSADLAAASNDLIRADGFGLGKPVEFALAIVGQVNSVTYAALADALDYLRASGPADAATERRRAIMKLNEAIRTTAARAAATGNWDEFDKLTGTLGTGAADPANASDGTGDKKQ